MCARRAQDRGLRMATPARNPGLAEGEGLRGGETVLRVSGSALVPEAWRTGRAVPLRPRPEARGLETLR